MASLYENSYALFNIENGIASVRFKAQTTLDLETAFVITTDRMHLQHYKPFRLLLDISGIWFSDKAGRDFMTQHGWLFIQRISIVATSRRSHAIGRYLLKSCPAKLPAKLFTNQQSALVYLRE